MQEQLQELWTEFKAFAMKGNVIDLAVAVVIGAAFGRIVTSLVNNIIMPPIGVILGGVDFSDLAITLKDAENGNPAVEIGYGLFINDTINFIIVAFAIFMVIRVINRLQREEPAPPPAPTEKQCPYCLENVPIKASKCKFCTSELEVA